MAKFDRRRARDHIFFGLAMAAAHWNRPLSDAIVVYRERTGDEETSDDRLYKIKAQMTELFKCAVDEAQSV